MADGKDMENVDARDIYGSMQGNHNTLIQNFQPPAKGFKKPYLTKRSLADFTGREQEIQTITARLTVENDCKAVAISAVSGMGGIGKTSLVRHIAWQLMEKFPDGQLYGDLRGQDDQPIAAKTILLEWLRLFGYDESELPTSEDELAGWLRCCLADKRLLIIIDNAHDERQVELLLPASAGCGVMITSREWLELDGVLSFELDVMTEAEALLLLRRIVGEAAVEGELAEAKQLMKLCGYLPLAIRITASQLAQKLANPKRGWMIAQQVAALADENTRLGELKGKYRSIEACFQLSYRDLSENNQQLISRLGVLRSQDFGVPLAVVMAASDDDASTHQRLEQLEAMQLLEIAGEERYTFHDLVRLFVRRKLDAEMQQALAVQALGWYNDNANMFDTCLIPELRRPTAHVLASEHGQGLETTEKSLDQMGVDWFEIERSNLVDAVTWAGDLGEHQTAVRLTGNLMMFFQRRSLWSDAVTTHEVSLASATAIGDQQSIAQTMGNLGVAYQAQGKWDDAVKCYQAALEISRTTGEQQDSAKIMNNLGAVYQAQGKWDDAIECCKAALATFRAAGDIQGIGNVMNTLGGVYQAQGKWDDAIECCQAALKTKNEIGDIHGVAKIRGNLGIIYQTQNKWHEAIWCNQAALETFREVGDIHGIGNVMNSLGNIYQAQGKWDDAINCYNASIQGAHQLGDPQTEANCWFNLGNAQAQLSQIEARTSYQNAKALFQQLKLTSGVENCDNAIAQIGQMARPNPSFKAPPIGEPKPTPATKPNPTNKPAKPFPLWQTAVILLLGYGLIQWHNAPPPPDGTTTTAPR